MIIKSRNVLIIFIGLIFLLNACEEEDLKNGNEITLSSEFHGPVNQYYRFGYSFEKAKFFQIPPAAADEVPDIFLEDILLPGEENLTAFLYSEESNKNGILKVSDFNTLAEAEDFYSGYTEAIVDTWTSFTEALQNYQVYIFKTSDNNYVKLLIQDVRIVDNLSFPDFMEVDLKYFIQRDGSVIFVE